MNGRVLRTAAGVFACVAVTASPTVARLPGAPLTVTDVALALTALCLIPSALTRHTWHRSMASAPENACARHLAGPLCLLAACVVSAASATGRVAATKEIVQLGLYIIVGTAAFRLLDRKRWRGALCCSLRAAIALGLALSLGALLAPDVFAPCLPPWPTFGAYLLVLACLTIALRSKPGTARSLRPAFVSGFSAALAIALATMAAGPAKASSSQAGPVPQQLREAYAALSVLADHPLLGVGPGNYQTHIGEYYQGMPKDNTMTPGTGVGYGILVASVGLLGLAAYLEWLRRLWRATTRTHLRMPLLALIVTGFFTPIFVGPMLLLLALLSSLAAFPARSEIIIRSKPLSRVPAALGCIALLLLSVRLVPGNAFTLVWEAEGFAELQAPIRVCRNVAEASGGSMLELPLGSGQGWRGKGEGSVTYRVDMPRAGQYRLWARTLWKDGCTNAIFLSANDGPRFVLGNDAVFNAWHWVKGQQLPLQKGLNYLVFANHSDGIALDKLLLTDDPLYVPAGLGEEVSRFFDGFAGCDADNTGSWEFPSGRWRVLRGAGEGSGGVNDCLAQWDPKGGTALGGFTAWHDYDARVRVMLPGNGTIGLTLFRDEEGAGLSLQCEVGDGEARFRLLQEKDGDSREIAQAGEAGNHADRWIELGVRIEKEAVVGLIDGRSLLRAAYDAPKRGQIALFSKGSSGAYFDNVQVTFRR